MKDNLTTAERAHLYRLQQAKELLENLLVALPDGRKIPLNEYQKIHPESTASKNAKSDKGELADD